MTADDEDFVEADLFARRAGRRSVELDVLSVDVLRRWRTTRMTEVLQVIEASWDEDGYVFCRPDGTPLDPGYISHAWRDAVRASKLSYIRLHDARHTWATLALKADVHPKVVQERLGHSSIGITLDTYSHVVPGMQETAAAKVSGAILGPLHVVEGAG